MHKNVGGSGCAMSAACSLAACERGAFGITHAAGPLGMGTRPLVGPARRAARGTQYVFYQGTETALTPA